MSRWSPWTPQEVALLREHYPPGGTRAVRAAGVNRSVSAIRTRAASANLRYGGDQVISLLGEYSEPVRGPQPFAMTPSRPRRITDALHELAETPGLTARQYDTRKARILRGETT